VIVAGMHGNPAPGYESVPVAGRLLEQPHVGAHRQGFPGAGTIHGSTGHKKGGRLRPSLILKTVAGRSPSVRTQQASGLTRVPRWAPALEWDVLDSPRSYHPPHPKHDRAVCPPAPRVACCLFSSLTPGREGHVHPAPGDNPSATDPGRVTGYQDSESQDLGVRTLNGILLRHPSRCGSIPLAGRAAPVVTAHARGPGTQPG